jgi:hypothetical protein
VLRLDGINFGADDKAKLWESLMDRLLATLPVAMETSPYGERTPERCEDLVPAASPHKVFGLRVPLLSPFLQWARTKPRTDVATCRRVSGIIGPLYVHENVKNTHHLMHHYFGFGSVSVLTQVAKFFEYEQLVSAEGANVYTSDENIRRYFDFPIALLHGKRNQVFDPESARRSRDRINSVRSDQPCVLIEARDYAHFDCLVGDKAYFEVFPRISDFFRNPYAEIRKQHASRKTAEARPADRAL